jgi:hypothetical protein
MKKLKLLVLTAVLFVIAFNAQAQESEYRYKHAAGVTSGYHHGLTYKRFIKENKALEGMLTTRGYDFVLTGLFEIHKPAFEVEGLYWYFGGGAHLGSGAYRSRYVYDDNENLIGVDHPTTAFVGLDAIGGMEYTFEDIPLNVGAYWKPSVDLPFNTSFDILINMNLTARYTFGPF